MLIVDKLMPSAGEIEPIDVTVPVVLLFYKVISDNNKTLMLRHDTHNIVESRGCSQIRPVGYIVVHKVYRIGCIIISIHSR